MVSHWSGPYQITGFDSPVNVKLKRLSDQVPLIGRVHINRLKPMIDRKRPQEPPEELKDFMTQGKDLSVSDIESGDITDDLQVDITTESQQQSSQIEIEEDVSDSETEKPMYEVENVLKGKYKGKQEPVFEVKWKGYNQSSWEPFSHLNGILQDMILQNNIPMKGKTIVDIYDYNNEETKKWLLKWGYVGQVVNEPRGKGHKLEPISQGHPIGDPEPVNQEEMDKIYRQLGPLDSSGGLSAPSFPESQEKVVNKGQEIPVDIHDLNETEVLENIPSTRVSHENESLVEEGKGKDDSYEPVAARTRSKLKL